MDRQTSIAHTTLHIDFQSSNYIFSYKFNFLFYILYVLSLELKRRHIYVCSKISNPTHTPTRIDVDVVGDDNIGTNKLPNCSELSFGMFEIDFEIVSSVFPQRKILLLFAYQQSSFANSPIIL